MLGGHRAVGQTERASERLRERVCLRERERERERVRLRFRLRASASASAYQAAREGEQSCVIIPNQRES
jgi:hypothetical protein